ncbi:hypothetical protein C5C39_02170 [Rathayibacter sp. AY1F3]|uniref:Pycsar system effector family protein n=1 Tax=Rathayibacter sp. AY1F3 TaxID=2080558 RepID=UPI000CE868AE|nr:Pycsar system effector family protein [Rathayibacter sp. AY1F3]PPG92837.1 hypothetical protein C5C39_02170 [Rathayibacter sp. AY1F3]
MSWMKPKSSPSPSDQPEGALEAMEHVSNWVRFADTKATILSAGVAAVLAMSVANAKTVLKQIDYTPTGIAIAVLATVSIAALLWTVIWIVRAITPSRTTGTLEPNRFAWPAMARLPLDDLQHHARTTFRDEDAWRQTHDLAKTADRKFAACKKATFGFAALIIATPACLITAISSSIS